MRMEDVSVNGMGKNRNRKKPVTISSRRAVHAIDREKQALVDAVRAAAIYAGIIVRFDGALCCDDALIAINEFLNGSGASGPFSFYCIARQEVTTTEYDHKGDESLVCWILFKAMGSLNAVMPELSGPPPSADVRIVTDYVQVQRELVARLGEFCTDSVCIAAGKGDGIVPLWMGS